MGKPLAGGSEAWTRHKGCLSAFLKTALTAAFMFDHDRPPLSIKSYTTGRNRALKDDLSAWCESCSINYRLEEDLIQIKSIRLSISGLR